jgi:Flp pilus assembly protein TadG
MRRTDASTITSDAVFATQAPAARREGHSGRRRGATVVEAAIVMNIFLLFLFAIMEFGNYVFVKQLMDNAARDGARMAALGPLATSTSQIQAQVTTELCSSGPSSLSIQVFQANPSTGANIGAWTNAGLGQTIAVQISGNYQPLLKLASLLPTAIPISSTAMVYSESPD